MCKNTKFGLNVLCQEYAKILNNKIKCPVRLVGDHRSIENMNKY